MPPSMDFKDLIALYRAAKSPEALREFQRALKARVEAANMGSETVFADAAGVFEEAPPKPTRSLETVVNLFTQKDVDRPVPVEVKKRGFIPGIPPKVQKIVYTMMASMTLTGKAKDEG